ncbi:hypothetical protein AVEN_56578-1 [Araneus ventricosus]|uniref:Uncharacterized protein n=1 Tax=Araneus ventricosus TaxID=182803 RepID=A0A4Y2SKM7_ARAVE|nr:hypothetical protein AVEN_56578-1 [Araneus ventricosus]
MKSGAAGDAARPEQQVAEKFCAVLRRTSKRKALRDSKPSSKTPKKSLAVVSKADSSSVWALVPKELVNSDHFKSHILKMQERPPRGRRPKKVSRASHVPEIQQIPFSRQRNIKLQFPMVPPVTAKPVDEEHPRPLPLPLRIDAQRNDTTAQSSPTIISNDDDDEEFSDD